MSSARRFNKRIGVYTNTAVADGYGGNTVKPTLIANVWAELKTLDKGDLTDFGITTANLGVECLVRKPDTFDYEPHNMFILYGDSNYTIISFTEDIDFKHRYIRFIAVKEK